MRDGAGHNLVFIIRDFQNIYKNIRDFLLCNVLNEWLFKRK